MDLASLQVAAALLVIPLAALQIVEIGIGVHNARRGKRIESEVREFKERLFGKDGKLRGGIDPTDAVAMREAKKLERQLTAAETEAAIIAEYGEHALAAKALLGHNWDVAMSSGWAGALRVIKPFLAGAGKKGGAGNSTEWR